MEGVLVFYGCCLYCGVFMVDGYVEGDNLICGFYGWDYCVEMGVSEYDNKEVLYRFLLWVEKEKVWVDVDEIVEWVEEYL